MALSTADEMEYVPVSAASVRSAVFSHYPNLHEQFK